MSITVRNLTKSFGTFAALQDVTIDIPSGELVALLGPSGSGKTTLLRIIAGLEFADSGTIAFEGEDVSDRGARDRRVGFVFQHYALFRHMTVFENIAFGLRVRPRKLRPSNDRIREKVHQLLSLIQLQNQAERYPSQLSGGQRQRVALARALAVEPSVLLLDEPFGALDAKVRIELRRWLRQLHDKVQVTSVFVTHDQEEALEVADRVAVMNEGRIEQIGTPGEIYERPATTFVAEFIGSSNMLRGRIVERRDGGAVVATEAGLRLFCAAEDGLDGMDGEISLLLRPERIRVETTGAAVGPGVNRVAARIADVTYLGEDLHLNLDLDSGERLRAAVKNSNAARGWMPAQAVELLVDAADLRLLRD